MTEPIHTDNPGALDFEKARFDDQAPGKVACTECGAVISDRYYDIDGNTVCPTCLPRASKPIEGSFTRSLLLGSAAAAVGFGIYYGISALTGYEFGLIAIAVGVMVGLAVRLGAGSNTSIIFRLLAVILTYLSIVSTYVPSIMEGFDNPASAETAAGSSAESADASPVGEHPTLASEQGSGNRSGVIVAAFVLALLIPFLSILSLENILGVVILAIGLYEAWKLSQVKERVIAGPFRLRDEPAGESAAAT